MIHLQKMILNNFMVYRGKHKIPLANLGVVRVEAINEDDPSANSNMAGKSTLLEALFWCLFGKTLRGLKHDQVINRKAKRNCSVALSFSRDGKSFSVVRNRKFADRSSLQLFSGNLQRDLTYRHEADTQAKIEEVLGCDYQAFVNSTVFGGFDGARKQFALMTDSEQKKILDSFLRFEKFTTALDRTKDQLHEARKQHTEVALKLERQRGLVSTLKGKIGALERSISVFRARELQDTRKTRKRLKRLPTLEKPSKRLLTRAALSLETFLEGKAVLEERLTGIGRQLESISKRKQQIGKRCPTCGQIVKHSESLDAHLKKDRIILKQRRKKLLSAHDETESEVNRGRSRLKRLTKRYNRQKSKFDTIIAKRRELEAQLRNQSRQAPFTDELETQSTEYSKQTSRLLVYEAELVSLKSKIKDLEFWEVGFGNKGVKALVMREILPAMNQKLKEYAREIFQSDVELEFRPSRENKKGEEKELFHLQYKSKRNSTNYTGESSGGRRRVDICVLLVFAWMSRVSDCLLVDELLDGLDATGREIVLQILSKQRGTVLVITHEQELKSKIGTVWTVRKKNGESNLETAA